MRPKTIRHFEMGSPCTWRRGDDRSITTAPVKTKRSEHVSSEEAAEACGSCIGFSTLCLRIDRHESVQWHVDVGQGAESSSYWGRDRLRKCQAWLFQGASKLPWGTSNQGTRAACCRRPLCFKWTFDGPQKFVLRPQAMQPQLTPSFRTHPSCRAWLRRTRRRRPKRQRSIDRTDR